jgi:hypothetical protein
MVPMTSTPSADRRSDRLAAANEWDVEAAASAMGLQIRVFNASIIAEIDTAFAPLASDRPEDLGSAVHGMPVLQLSAVETPL